MPKRLITGTIVGLERKGDDGKKVPFSPTVGTQVDLTNDEIKQIEAVDKTVIREVPKKDGSRRSGDTNSDREAEVPVSSDPVNGLSAGSGDPADADNAELMASKQENPKPAVDSGNVRVKGSKPTKPPGEDDL